MPTFTRTYQIIAGVLSIPVIGIAIIGTQYTSPFLTHLAEIVNGNQTATIVSTNAPNWSFGMPLAQVVGVSVATTSGTLASSTPFSITVAALDGIGTTTLSSAVTQSTDATGLPNQGLNITWASVPGATGYAIFEATGTVSTANGFSQYFYATSTSGVPNTQYTLSTTTGSLAGAYTKSDTTAFAIKFNPLGNSYFGGGKLGVGTSSPLEQIDVASGTIRAIGSATSTCNAQNAGSIQFQATSGHFYGCLTSGTWQQLDN